MKRYNSLLILFTFCICGFPFNQAAATLSMRQAFHALKETGFKWRQTNLLTKQALSLEKQAGAALSPHVEFVAREFVGRINQSEYGFNTPGDLSIFAFGDTGLEGTFALIDSGARERLKAASENVKYSGESAKQFQSDLTYMMLIQYLNNQRLSKKIQTIQTTLERDHEIVKLAQARVRAGAGLFLDVVRAEGLIEVDHLKELDTTTTSLKYRQDFFALLGISQAQEEFPPLTYREINPSDTRSSLEKAHTQRPDLLASKALIKVAESLRLQAQKEDSPKLQLFGELGVAGAPTIGSSGTSMVGTLGIQLTIPLIDGSYYEGRVEEASVKIENVELQDKQSTLEADNQVTASLAQLAEGKKAIEVSNHQIETAAAEMKLAKKRFLSGAATGLELANAQTGITAAADANIEATFAYEVAKLNYFKSIGDFEKYLALQDESSR